MNDPTRLELISRDAVLKLLSDHEVARVSTAETKSSVAAGADFIDLEHLDKGVQRNSAAATVAMGDIIPRTAVSDQTWAKILEQLAR